VEEQKMQIPGAAVTIILPLLFNSLCSADEPPTAGAGSTTSKSSRTDDGWRPAGTKANGGGLVPEGANADFAESFTARAQSPDDGYVPSGPAWNYPSRHRPTSVPVPAVAGEPDFSKQRAGSDRVAGLPQQRLAASRASRSVPQGGAATASYQEEYPYGRSTFHPSPFDRGAPSCPVDSGSGAPCRTSPFEDACGMGPAGYSNYSWDNIYFFTIGEAFRLDHENTRAALRSGLNWGLPLVDDDVGLGFQIGFSGSLAEEGNQFFVTSGVFYRGDMRLDSAWNVGAVFDWMQDDEFEADVSQIRGKTSFTIDRKNEIGVWGAASLSDEADQNGETVESVDQINLFYRYLFDSDWDVTWWAGWRSDPESVAFGISTYRPINDYWAGIFGAYYAPDGDTWNIYSGIVRHWGQRAAQDYLGQDRHQPYLPVADNTSMTLFTHR
jgi:hypothetical protein